MSKALEIINQFVWGIPALLLILFVGIWLTFRTGAAQIRFLPRAAKDFWHQFRRKPQNKNEVSGYQALCTALAATVGTGNIIGVAGAIALGGPGAVFWMWVCGFFGMVTKYAEATLAVRYRVKNQRGEWSGGPMYMIEQGLGKGKKWLAKLYCIFGVIAAFGVGNITQIHAVVNSVNSAVVTMGGTPGKYLNMTVTVLLAVFIGIMLMGGAARIGTAAERLVPFAAGAYILLCLGFLLVKLQTIPGVLCSIVTGAFSPRAVTGGLIGSAFQALRVGASRGVFTNEAGMGTASIAHGGAQVSHPVQQGLMGIMEVFIDTIVICTLTALVILTSGIQIPFGNDVGSFMTGQAFSAVYGSWIYIFLAVALCCFAVATVLGWGLYGARCAQYLFGDNVWEFFVVLQVIMIILGGAVETKTVWLFAETINGLMAIPNLLALFLLTPELRRLTKDYGRVYGCLPAVGGTYEDFNQRKPVRAVSHAEVSSHGGQGRECRKENLSSEHRTA